VICKGNVLASLKNHLNRYHGFVRNVIDRIHRRHQLNRLNHRHQVKPNDNEHRFSINKNNNNSIRTINSLLFFSFLYSTRKKKPNS